MFRSAAGDERQEAMTLTPKSGWRAIGAIALSAIVLDTAAQQPGGPRAEVVVQAMALLDVPYRYGGSTPAGFDCSGLVRYVFKAVTGRELPRRTQDMSRVGRPIRRSELLPGDLVYFNTFSSAYSHVAIYVGDGRFLHAPARGGRVRIEGLDDRYWKWRYDGARRLIEDQFEPSKTWAAAPPLLETDRITP
jgi:cell wall-associated NlpC family hydrolase